MKSDPVYLWVAIAIMASYFIGTTLILSGIVKNKYTMLGILATGIVGIIVSVISMKAGVFW